MTTTKIIKNDGSNGYHAGNWEWQISSGGSLWFDGGYSSRAHAKAALAKKVRELKKDGLI